MKRKIHLFAIASLATALTAQADNVTDEDELLCATSRAMLCVEDGTCFSVSILDTKVPQFVLVDLKKKTISTTKTSGEDRVSPVATVEKSDGRIFMQSMENNRAYSAVIDEISGQLTLAIANDGITMSVFGACTSADLD